MKDWRLLPGFFASWHSPGSRLFSPMVEAESAADERRDWLMGKNMTEASLWLLFSSLAVDDVVHLYNDTNITLITQEFFKKMFSV